MISVANGERRERALARQFAHGQYRSLWCHKACLPMPMSGAGTLQPASQPGEQRHDFPTTVEAACIYSSMQEECRWGNAAPVDWPYDFSTSISCLIGGILSLAAAIVGWIRRSPAEKSLIESTAARSEE